MAMSFAVVNIAGTQEKVSPGLQLQVPLLKGAKEGGAVRLDKVLLVSAGKGKITVGSPYVKGALVEAKVLHEGKDKKVTVFKMKHRKRYRRKRGHRQDHVTIEITKIKG